MARNWYDSIVPADAAAYREIDVTVAHPARVYDYWLGGKDNFAADRQAAEEVLKAKPGIRLNVRANRGFLARSVRYLAGEAGISQFLDIGTGIPAANNTHEVAQAVRPDARVVYIDNDPIVLTHARALLTSTQGATSFIEADLRDTGLILNAAAKTLDFSKPVAVMMIAVLHLVPDQDDPWRIVSEFMRAVPPGSYLPCPIRPATSTPATPSVPPRATTSTSPCPCGGAAGKSSAGSSTAWRSSSRASCRRTSGGRPRPT